MSNKTKHLAPGTEYVRTGVATRLTGLSAKTLLKVATANKVRIRQFPGMIRGLQYHRGDLIDLMGTADRGREVRAS